MTEPVTPPVADPASATDPKPARTGTERDERRTKLNGLRDELRSLDEAAGKDGTLTDEQEARMGAIIAEFPALEAAVKADETRAAAIDAVRNSKTGTAPGHDRVAPGQINRESAFVDDVRSLGRMGREEIRDRALRATEQRVKEGRSLTNGQEAALEKLLRTQNGNTDGSLIARRLLVSESDEYRSAFAKGLAGAKVFTEAEGAAMEEMRAMNEGTGSAGGFGIPVLIDPTIMIQSGATLTPIVDISRVETITTNQWKGVSSAPVQWNFDAESAQVADGSTTLKQPIVPVYKADGFVPFTVEVDQDYPGFQDEMAKLLSAGYIDLLAQKSAVGAGSTEPTGAFTSAKNNTVSPAHVVVTTVGVIGSVDLRATWGALPERFRDKATYMMNVQVQNQVSALGNGLALSDYTVNLLADGTYQLTGRPIKLTDYAPTFTNTTAVQSALLLGDFSNFLIAQRAGMVVEPVPHLFGANGRPIGQRGLYAWARVGSDILVQNAFRLLASV